MRANFGWSDRVDEFQMAIRDVIVREGTWNRIDDAKSFFVRRTIRFGGTTEEFDGRRGRETITGGRLCGQSENELHSIAGLARGEIRDRDGNRRRRRNRLTGSATARGNKKDESGE